MSSGCAHVSVHALKRGACRVLAVDGNSPAAQGRHESRGGGVAQRQLQSRLLLWVAHQRIRSKQRPERSLERTKAALELFEAAPRLFRERQRAGRGHLD